jgi:type III pantothenate kinase
MNSLCMDLGNTNIYAGLFSPGGDILLRFRKTSSAQASADEHGIFLRSVLRENGFDPSEVDRIGVCSVVPDAVYSVRRACQKYFGLEPFFLQAGARTGLQIAYRNPLEVGADRIANAIAAVKRYPGRDCLIADMGTATTVDAVSADRRYLGGAIIPGLRIAMESLEKRTAKLPAVEIVKPERACGRSTAESIQAGLYFEHLGAIKELSARIGAECFGQTKPLLLATGGLSQLFADSGLFDAILPDLVLEGLREAMLMNGSEAGARSKGGPA